MHRLLVWNYIGLASWKESIGPGTSGFCFKGGYSILKQGRQATILPKLFDMWWLQGFGFILSLHSLRTNMNVFYREYQVQVFISILKDHMSIFLLWVLYSSSWYVHCWVLIAFCDREVTMVGIENDLALFNVFSTIHIWYSCYSIILELGLNNSKVSLSSKIFSSKILNTLLVFLFHVMKQSIFHEIW